jgi:D-glycero-beta-D-manno-heptose 1-phosphate adenylyltransferase
MIISKELQQKLQELKANGDRVVLVTGFFDLLHAKHKEFLGDAKKLGDFLVVAVESDLRARQVKGEGRPYFKQEVRLANLRHLKIADEVMLLPDDFDQPSRREELIAEIKPDFLAVSSHSVHQEAKKGLVEKYGGKLVVVTEYDPNFSSSKIIEKLRR